MAFYRSRRVLSPVPPVEAAGSPEANQDQPRVPDRLPPDDPGHHSPPDVGAAGGDRDRVGDDPDSGPRLPPLHPVAG